MYRMHKKQPVRPAISGIRQAQYPVLPLVLLYTLMSDPYNTGKHP